MMQEVGSLAERDMVADRSSDRVDALVIGAGHNGLVCAAYLAKAGMKVLVLERSNYAGGACITQELLPGFRFSTFAYTAHGPGPKICSDLEIPAEAFEIARLDPEIVQLYPDRDRLILWRDIGKTEQELARLSRHDSRNFTAYREFCQRAQRICADFFLQDAPDPSELRKKWTDSKDSRVIDILLDGSLWDVITEFFEHEKVRMAFARADDAGPTHHKGSALAEFVESASTGLGIRNQSGILRYGMGSISKVLAERVTTYGGAIRLNAEVDRILVEGGEARGVQLKNGARISARMVISNADPKRTFLKLLNSGDIEPEFRRAVAELRTRASYMKFHAVLKQLPQFQSLRPEERADAKLASSVRILPSLDYMEQSWQDCMSGEMPRNPVLSVQIPTAYWPEQAPPGKHILGAWIRWAPSRFHDGSSWDDRRQEMTDRIIAILDDYAPGFSSSIEWCRLFTPFDIEQTTGITDASIRHVDMTLDQMLNRRPLPGWCQYESPIRGLWLCGSGTHPCGSVTGAPGHNCARAILRSGKS
jgi:phytoene dehydrogenase-like protein